MLGDTTAKRFGVAMFEETYQNIKRICNRSLGLAKFCALHLMRQSRFFAVTQPSTQAFSSRLLDSTWCKKVVTSPNEVLAVCHSVRSRHFAPKARRERLGTKLALTYLNCGILEHSAHVFLLVKQARLTLNQILGLQRNQLLNPTEYFCRCRLKAWSKLFTKLQSSKTRNSLHN